MGFKDMMKSFLYETVEDEDDYEEEEEVVQNEPKRSFFHKKEEAASISASEPEAVPASQSAPAPQSAQSAPVYPTTNPYAQNPQAVSTAASLYSAEELYTTPQVNPGTPEQSSSFLSRIDEAMVEETPKSRPAGNVRRAANRPQPNYGRQDFSNVISPIYGTFAEEEIIPEAVHNAVDLPKPVDATEMVEIISPIYGTMTVPANKKKKIQPVQAAKSLGMASSKGKKAAPRNKQPERYSALEKAVDAESTEEIPAKPDQEAEAAPALEAAPATETPSAASVTAETTAPEAKEARPASKAEKTAPARPASSSVSYKPNKPAFTADLGSYLSRGSTPKNRAGASRAELLEPVLEEQAKKGSKK